MPAGSAHHVTRPNPPREGFVGQKIQRQPPAKQSSRACHCTTDLIRAFKITPDFLTLPLRTGSIAPSAVEVLLSRFELSEPRLVMPAPLCHAMTPHELP